MERKKKNEREREKKDAPSLNSLYQGPWLFVFSLWLALLLFVMGTTAGGEREERENVCVCVCGACVCVGETGICGYSNGQRHARSCVARIMQFILNQE